METAKLYCFKGIDYNKARRFMKKNGYTGMSLDGKIRKNESIVLSIDHKHKIVKYMPAEIYASGSPIENQEKLHKILNACGNYYDFTEDAKGE